MHVDALQVQPSESTPDPLWQHQLGLLLESTGEGIFGIDLAGHCMFINRAGARMLGFEPAEVLGQNMHELTHHSHADGSHYPDTDCPIFNAFRKGLPCRLDTEVFWRRDHTSFAVEYSSYPIVDGTQVRGAVITFVDITERKRTKDALQKSKDELGSLLVALKMDVNWLDKRLSEQQQRELDAAQAMRERMRSKCQNMSRLIESAVDNVGRIITDLRPGILDHQGLWAALEWQARDFVQSAELQLDWHMQVAPGVELPEPAAMAVFRIFHEMLSNVGRHARATRVVIRIDADARSLVFTVQDNGRGAAAEAFDAPTAYGVMGMRERARNFGGHINIVSEIGQGSIFRLMLPLRPVFQPSPKLRKQEHT